MNNLNDLISRDAAIKWFFRPYSNEESYSNLDIERALKAIPAVDAAPVVHGRWIFHEENGPMDAWLTCSVCGKENGIHEGNYYCPNCGAKMDKEK